MNNKLNITAKEFTSIVGIPYNANIMKSLRDLNLVGWFKIGKKFMYHFEDTQKISNKLRNKEIQLKVKDARYYFAFSEID